MRIDWFTLVAQLLVFAQAIIEDVSKEIEAAEVFFVFTKSLSLPNQHGLTLGDLTFVSERLGLRTFGERDFACIVGNLDGCGALFDGSKGAENSGRDFIDIKVTYDA